MVDYMDNGRQEYYEQHSLIQRVRKSWDENVAIRVSDLEEATDTSYINLILPLVMNKVMDKTDSNSKIIDIGCGCGFLTNAIYEKGCNQIIGIDISPVSIAYAKKRYPDIMFLCDDICRANKVAQYDLALAVMVLNNMPDVQSFFNSISRLLVVGGTLIIVLPHPCFWPQQHLKNSSFAYSKEIPYEFTFATHGRKDYSSRVLYFHRMLETYLLYIEQAGFIIKDFCEVAETTIERNPDILCIELMYMPTREKTQ